MVSHLFFYQLVLVALGWLCLMLQWAWPSDHAAVCPTTPEPTPPLPRRTREPTPFARLTTKPSCDACEHTTDSRPQAPSAPIRMKLSIDNCCKFNGFMLLSQTRAEYLCCCASFSRGLGRQTFCGGTGMGE